ncbi:MAG: hypothetical protein ABW321_28305 [Polyangiales bacterium]
MHIRSVLTGLWIVAAVGGNSLAGCGASEGSVPTQPGAETEGAPSASTAAPPAPAGTAGLPKPASMVAGAAASAPAVASADSGVPAAAASGGPDASAAAPSQPVDPRCAAGSFDSTFAAIQSVIFDGHSCTNAACHGAAAVGGLDLRPDAAYDNLVEVKSAVSTLQRVMPGRPEESLLYNKLRAATEPDSVKVEGSPMPSGAPPLSAEHLEVVRRWIEAGAPRAGSIGDSVTGQSDKIAALLGSCLPDATPIQIAPLAAPAADEGVQFVMPSFKLKAGTETEVCFAQYYDLSNVVPAEYQDQTQGVIFVNGQRIRQDPQSHHLGLIDPKLSADWAGDASFGAWQCVGGELEGQRCDPLGQSGCGAGQCASAVQEAVACIGFGPLFGDVLGSAGGFARAQTAQYYQQPRDGVYSTFPVRGLVYWNSHAFNLTENETTMHAWINLYYAKDRQHELKNVTVTQNIAAAAGIAPFTSKAVCGTWVAPQNALLYNLTSHTHKRGGHFTVDLSDGTRIYESAIYTDPVEQAFDPPMHFDAADEAKRTLKYCADFNNGITEAGTPDLELVTRLSKMPKNSTCEPVACAAGKVGAPCDGAADDAACDSAPGAGDGSCDACPITAGQTTEDEMFVLNPHIVIP